VNGSGASASEADVDEKVDLSDLLSGLRAGDKSAGRQLYERYGPFIRTAVRRQLHPKLRSRFDTLDFVHDVWTSFLGMPAEQYQFDSYEDLLSFLNRVAYNKVVEVFRQRFKIEHVASEVTLDPTDKDKHRTAPSPQPTPSQRIIADDELDNILNRFPPGHRVIVARLREGYTIDDIVKLTNVSRRTVDRIVRRLKEMSGV
jgi:RNA polymerase sigma factor (sigma-70 family)